MPYDANVAALQSAVNRFAAVGGFSPISVDGLWGQNTINGTYKSLSWIGAGKCAPAGCPDDDDTATAATLVTRWDQGPSSASGISQFMSGVADEIGLAHVGVPVKPITLPPNPMTTALFPLASNGWLDKLKSLPTWQKVLLGLAFGFGALWTYNHVVKR